jgi:hypothetical protein
METQHSIHAGGHAGHARGLPSLSTRQRRRLCLLCTVPELCPTGDNNLKVLQATANLYMVCPRPNHMLRCARLHLSL